jgi:hypothetical protein
MNRVLRRAAAVCALALAGATGAVAQPPPQPDYHPSLADLMTMAVQPRHTKIGLAGQARNWGYLTYEVDELKNAFNRIARTVPTYSQQPLEPVIATRIRPQIERLEAAVKAQDARRFDSAYADLTDACNTCHKALGKDWIVIRAPNVQAYPDQVFGRSR